MLTPERVAGYLARIKRYTHDRGLTISGTGVKNDFATADKAVRAEGVALTKLWIEVAARLGAPYEPVIFAKLADVLEALGVDIMMCLDECPPFPCPEAEARRAAENEMARSLADRTEAEVPRTDLVPALRAVLEEGMVFAFEPNACLGQNRVNIGGTVIVMEHFDPQNALALIERYRVTHSQWVPTMFVRMLKLPESVRRKYDLSSLEIAIHAAAPCPVQVKEQMIQWWGPIIDEYYGATEGLGFTACNSKEWLAHKGTVGKVLLGKLHVLDDAMVEQPVGTAGTLWFETATPFEYFNDPGKTKEARSPDGSMRTVGDVGYVDGDGYLYLTDRATFMIISGGVNIYPQECENLLITHPKVADAAVFGVPNTDLGEEVKAVVQLMPGIEAGPATAEELLAFCGQHLARQKVPRSIDFEAELPRLPTGKLYKKPLRERYWADKKSRIL